MAAVDWFKGVWAYLVKLAGLGQYCFEDVGKFDECESMWMGIGVLLAIVCVLALAFIARHFSRAYFAHRRAWAKRQAELEVATPEVMAQAKWTGENAIDASVSQEEMIRRIRQAKERLKSGDASDKPGGDKALGKDALNR